MAATKMDALVVSFVSSSNYFQLENSLSWISFPAGKRFFGNVRSFGGHEDHPTIVNFSYIFRLLTIYAPMKAAIKGDVEAHEDILPVLSGVLEAGVKDECHKEKLNTRLEKKLEELCFGLQDTSTMAALPSTSKDHLYSKTAAEDCVVHYAAGYIVSWKSPLHKPNDPK
ncbi:hypothetical protein HPB52_000130 [Rhipicephalus sanguineus]|uniref:Uncharacterized protein n=1 Tax=Rhipicephalus sanguineus TaxID=34632 RepID=A0A9D4Q434_RHISA|nr:hypothetical protein HPB52_000130 [Rhipicephalus sanguineus]